MQQAPTYVANPTALDDRKAALFDLAYVAVSLWLYVISIIQPVIGIAGGLLLVFVGVHPKTKQVGKICIILGSVFFVLVALFLALWFGLGMAAMIAGGKS